MQKLIFILLILTGCATGSRADTVDYWHVYYNNIKLKEYNQVVLNQDTILNNDSIFVKYFRDTPCSDCSTFLTVEDEKGNRVLTSRGKGTFNPISFSLMDLIGYKRKNSAGSFEVYYFEGGRSIKERKNLFAIIITGTPEHAPVTGQTDRITTARGKSFNDDDFEPSLFFTALISICMVFVLIGVGIIIAAAVLFLFFGLLSLGVLSTSVLVALKKRSFRKGFKIFLLLSGSISGVAIGVVIMYSINMFFDLHFTTLNAILTGAVSGMVSGFLLGYITYVMVRSLTTYFKKKLYLS